MPDITFTPSELTNYIYKKINQDKYLNSFQLIGEVSNLSSPPSGHHYFVIKDDESLIKCVLFSRGSGKENLKDFIYHQQAKCFSIFFEVKHQNIKERCCSSSC